MPKQKRKTLPKGFEQLVLAGEIEEIKAIFNVCELNARGGTFKQTALAFNELPDDVTRWLVEQGADLSAPDSYGETPLHARSGHWQGNIDILLELGADIDAVDNRGDTPLHKAASVGHARNVERLLDRGAQRDACNNAGLTPLEQALLKCTNPKIPQILAVTKVILSSDKTSPKGISAFASRLFGARREQPARISPRAQDFVRRIGENFEFHRAAFNSETKQETSAALDELYELFDVPPVPRRMMHDGISPIVATGKTWQKRQEEYWAMLVPSSGSASTVQGEVTRIAGRISRELDGNGGINWDDDFRLMADALRQHLSIGNSLPSTQLEEATQIIREVKRKDGNTHRLVELAVTWVDNNPNPIPLATPAYSR